MKRLRVGQKVKLSNPVGICARFYNRDTGYIHGAGGIQIDRNLLDGIAYVVSLAAGSKGTRGLIAFGSPDSNTGMWLGIESLEKVQS